MVVISIKSPITIVYDNDFVLFVIIVNVIWPEVILQTKSLIGYASYTRRRQSGGARHSNELKLNQLESN